MTSRLKPDAPLVYRIIEWGLEKSSFTQLELEKALLKSNDEIAYVKNTLTDFVLTPLGSRTDKENPNHIMSVVEMVYRYENEKTHLATQVPDFANSHYAILSTAIFHYYEFIELQEARKSAVDAKRLSTFSIWLAIGSMILSAVVGGIQIYIDLHP